MLEIHPEAVAIGNPSGVDKRSHLRLHGYRLCAVVHRAEAAATAAPPAPKLYLKDSYRSVCSASSGPEAVMDASSANIDADFSNTL
jgi:hypothetical protein